jgi:hypothetical protein
MRITGFVSALAFVAITASPSLAQEGVASTDRPLIAGRALGGALLGTVGGGLLGGVTGFWLGGKRCVDRAVAESCHYLDGAAIGTAIGVTLGAPVGAHYLNRRRGNVAMSVLASVAIGTAGVLALREQDDRPAGGGRTRAVTAIVIVTPALQILSSALIESR